MNQLTFSMFLLVPWANTFLLDSNTASDIVSWFMKDVSDWLLFSLLRVLTDGVLKSSLHWVGVGKPLLTSEYM